MVHVPIFLSVVAAIGVLAATLCAPALPYIADHFAAGIASVQFTLSLFLVGNALGQLFSGPLSDHIGQRKVMMCGLTLFIAASGWAGLADEMPFLLAARFFQGMGSAVGPVLARAIAARLYPPNRSAEVQSYAMLVIGIVSMLGLIASGYLTLYSWRYNFWLAALAGTMLLLWTRHALKPSADIAVPQKRPFVSSFAQVFRTPVFLSNALCHSLTYGLMYGYIGLFPFLLIHYLHEVDPSMIGYYSALMIGCYMVGAFFNSRLVRRYDPQRMVVIGIILQCIGGVLLAASAAAPLFFTALAIFNLSLGIVLPATSACALAACRESSGSASSALGLSYRLIGSLLSMLITWLPLTGSMAGGMSLGLSICLLSMVSLALLWFYHHRARERFIAA